MIVYVESSAVLAWVLGESTGEEMRRLLAGSERVVSSTLTPLESARALARDASSGRVDRKQELAARQLLDTAAASWVLMEMSGPVLRRARAAFPVEPVRTLDAIHLATAAAFHEAHAALTVLTLDHRVRDNAVALGIDVVP